MKFSLAKKIATGVLLLVGLQAGAQSRVITFGSTHDYHSSNDVTGKNSLSIGLASWINGYTPLYYERYLTDFLSIQVGAGFTYRSYLNDLGAEIWQDGSHDDNWSSSDIEDHYNNYKYRTTKPGFYMSVAPKFYLQSECMSGFYVSPMLEYKTYNYQAEKANVNVVPYETSYVIDKDVPRSNDLQPEYMHCVDFTSNIGGHYQTGGHVSIDWNFGFGFRKYSAQRLDMSIDNNGTNYSYVNNVRKYSGVRPLLTLNFAIGGWF